MYPKHTVIVELPNKKKKTPSIEEKQNQNLEIEGLLNFVDGLVSSPYGRKPYKMY